MNLPDLTAKQIVECIAGVALFIGLVAAVASMFFKGAGRIDDDGDIAQLDDDGAPHP